MQTLASVAAAAIMAVGMSSSEAAGGGTAGPELGAAESFAFGIGDGMLNGSPAMVAARLGDYDLVVVDGEEASRGDVEALQAEGSIVLAYLSVGTIEAWRSWYEEVKRYRLKAWPIWNDEWFADVSKAGFRNKIAREIAPEILAGGFDGLFLDNVDMIEANRYAAQRPGMRRLVAMLGNLVHADGDYLFAQNGYYGFDRYGVLEDGHLDGWNREDVTWTYDFDRERYVRNSPADRNEALSDLEAMRDLGLFTTATNYTKRSTGRAADESVADACSVGSLPFVGDVYLTAARLPASPYVCP